jgi:hypothetical protein
MMFSFCSDVNRTLGEVALHYMHYNFCRIHKTLKITPAMAAGVTTTLWSVADIAVMVEAAEPPPATRGTYRKASHAEDQTAKL